MIAHRYWLDVSSQFQGLLEETEFVIGFQLRDKASVFDNIDYVFKNYFIYVREVQQLCCGSFELLSSAICNL